MAAILIQEDRNNSIPILKILGLNTKKLPIFVFAGIPNTSRGASSILKPHQYASTYRLFSSQE